MIYGKPLYPQQALFLHQQATSFGVNFELANIGAYISKNEDGNAVPVKDERYRTDKTSLW